MYSNQRYVRQPIGFGGGGTPPPDVLILLGVLFVTYAMVRMGFDALAYLYLSPAVFGAGFLWQLLTYAFVGVPTGGLWFLISLLILFWFSRDVFRVLGRRSFWRLVLFGVAATSITTTLVHLVLTLGGWALPFPYYPLVQGQYILLTIMIAAFAVLYGNATIYFMFVLPIRARWFLWIEILLGFMGYLDTRDFAGFMGICAAVGMTYSMLTTGSLQRSLKEIKLRIERRYLELKMKRMRSRRGMRIVKKDDDVHRGPWVN